MKLAQFEMSVDEVEAHAARYANPQTKYDRMMAATIASMEEALKRVDSGALIVNLQETLRRGGSVRGFPAIGFAPAPYHGKQWQVRVHDDGAVTYEGRTRWQRMLREPVRFPRESFTSPRWQQGNSAWTTIPVIPPDHRPKSGLKGLLHMWEAQWNVEVPNLDPALLRPIGKGLAEVIDQWDLTPLEAEALRYL